MGNYLQLSDNLVNNLTSFPIMHKNVLLLVWVIHEQ